MKNTKLGEKMRMQFRAEFFDLFNHANFGQPGNVVGQSGLWPYHEHPLSNRRIRVVAADAAWHQTDFLDESVSKSGCAMTLFCGSRVRVVTAGRRAQQSRAKTGAGAVLGEPRPPCQYRFRSKSASSPRILSTWPHRVLFRVFGGEQFPGRKQSTELLRDYMWQKYAGRPIDVVVATRAVALDFLLKYRSELFPGYPYRLFLQPSAPATRSSRQEPAPRESST